MLFLVQDSSFLLHGFSFSFSITWNNSYKLSFKSPTLQRPPTPIIGDKSKHSTGTQYHPTVEREKKKSPPYLSHKAATLHLVRNGASSLIPFYFYFFVHLSLNVSTLLICSRNRFLCMVDELVAKEVVCCKKLSSQEVFLSCSFSR